MWSHGKRKLLYSINQSNFSLYSTRRIVYLALFIVVMSAVLLSANAGNSISGSLNLFGIQPVMAQSVDVGNVSPKIYQQLPDFPKENNYTRKEGGSVAENNTLVSRMIQYHTFVKGRAPNYRFDWKLTIADYLGVNEAMSDNTYPGADTLRQNPLDSDRAAIKKLSRSQRNALVQALVNGFSKSSG
jgi:hypothetical protein